MRRMLLASVFVPALLFPFFANAQDATTQLPDLVVTATRVPTPVSQIAAGVTVIDRKDIETHGYTTLAQALQAVPGMNIVQSGGPGGVASVFIRGTNSDQVLVLRDGMPVNDPSTPNGQFDFGVDTLDDIERIEVVRGPMSSMYGSGAVGGVINLITRRGSGKPTATATLAFGLPRAVLGSAGISGSNGIGKLGDLDYALHAEHQDQRGFDTTPRNETIYTGSPNGFRSDAVTINLGLTPVEGTRVYTYLRARTARSNLDEFGFPNYDANNFKSDDQSLIGRVGVDSKLFGGVWETGLALGRLEEDRLQYEPLEAADPNFTSGLSKSRGIRVDLQWNNTIHLPDAGPARQSAIVFGYEHIDDTADFSSTSSSGFVSSVYASAKSDAGHIGAQTTLFNRLTVTADARQQDARYGGDATTWRAGGVFAVPEIWSRFKASYGTAFLAPSLFDLFGIDNFGDQGNPNLKPERSEGYELGYAIDLPAFGRSDAATVDLTYFNNRVRDLIVSEPMPDLTFVPQNVDRAKMQGMESSLTLRAGQYGQAVLTYTLTSARDASNDTPLLRRPAQQASVLVQATPIPKLSIAPEMIYIGSFQDFAVDSNGFPAFTSSRAKSGLIFNLTVSYEITPQLTAFVDARNLGGSNFQAAGGYQMPGASALMGVRARF